MNAKSLRCLPAAGNSTALAAAIASLLGLGAPNASSAPLIDPGVVTSCDDPTTPTFGTLRYAAANVPDGGTIDMTGTSCGPIFLNFANGAIQLQQSSVTINGPGKQLQIEGRWNHNCYSGGQPILCPSVSNVFNHTGAGTLTIKNLTISYGKTQASAGIAAGGCVYSAGSLDLEHVDVHDCVANQFGADAYAASAKGGALYAKGILRFKYGALRNSTVSTADGLFAFGGGAYAGDQVLVSNSTVTGNVASGSIAAAGGGAIAARHSVYLLSSTVSGNTAAYGGGVYGGTIYAGAALDTDRLWVFDSTISGNSATGFAGGIDTRVGNVDVENSTIAFNSGPSDFHAAGLNIYVGADGHSITLQSSIIAQNYAGASKNDLYSSQSMIHPVTIAGANNLIGSTFGNAAPGDTSVACPRLGPLRDNGGPTKTHALLSGSPAIDVGNAASGFPEDQRGLLSDPGPTYPYPRKDLVTDLPDVGAYEVQQDDVVFNASFDGCADLPFEPPS